MGSSLDLENEWFTEGDDGKNQEPCGYIVEVSSLHLCFYVLLYKRPCGYIVEVSRGNSFI